MPMPNSQVFVQTRYLVQRVQRVKESYEMKSNKIPAATCNVRSFFKFLSMMEKLVSVGYVRFRKEITLR